MRSETLKKKRENHGCYKRSEYTIWCSIIQRCYNKNNKKYLLYGGRGISMSPRWRQSFSAFLEDVGPRPSPLHSLDRHPDNDGNYDPGNCRWATQSQQLNNTSCNLKLTYNCITMTASEWSASTGMSHFSIRKRFHRGWSDEKSLTTPIAPQSRFVEHNGENLSLSEWARRSGISRELLGYRLKAGWSFDRAITTPVKQYNLSHPKKGQS